MASKPQPIPSNARTAAQPLNGAGHNGQGLNAASKPDVRALMHEIRSRIAADVEANRDKRPAFVPKVVVESGASRKAGELLYSEELRYLNSNYAYGMRLNLDSVKSHRPGIIGKIIVKFKRKLLTIIWHNLLQDYFSSEKEYQASLVRYLNDVAKYVDARDASNFWELIRKIDYDVTKALDRIERINDEQMAAMRSSERRVHDALNDPASGTEAMRASVARHEDQLKTLDSVTRGLEGIISSLRAKTGSAGPGAKSEAAPIDYSYLLLENRFRGSEVEIRRRLSIYPPLFAGASKPVLEIGPGRGELQQLFKEQHVPSYGIDMDPAMVEACKAKGFDVRQGNGLEHLANLADGSLGGVIAIQVVEHLTHRQLEEFCELCKAKLAVAGKVVFETIDPRSLLALSSNYFRDPTHVFPQHPDTLRYTLELRGLKVLEVRNLSPVASSGQLQEVAVAEYMTPRWAQAIQAMNSNIKQLNGMLYGHQDFCVVAEKVTA